MRVLFLAAAAQASLLLRDSKCQMKNPWYDTAEEACEKCTSYKAKSEMDACDCWVGRCTLADDCADRTRPAFCSECKLPKHAQADGTMVPEEDNVDKYLTNAGSCSQFR
mmetsp:Transcript_2730/g.6175  ORF Transcript_2730/g.6175 Transcript_2730/m.6175 type:complete len:109 (+) Transcript_2730:75-401(+)